MTIALLCTIIALAAAGVAISPIGSLSAVSRRFPALIYAILVFFLVACLVPLVLKGYSVTWTGFGPTINGDGKRVPAKTLWDWLGLLIVPLFLALAAWVLNGSRQASDLRVESDRQRQKTLDDYFACMLDMLSKKPLPWQKSDVERSIARTRTLAALRSLDGGRKAQILQFLYEAGLVDTNPAVQLNGADFSGAELDEAVLRNAELRGVHFERASLRSATLAGADLRGSDFSRVDFTDVDLTGANLTQAVLTAARVSASALATATTDQAILPVNRT